MAIFNERSFNTAQDIIDFMDISSTVLRFNFVGYTETSNISGTSHYITVCYSTDVEITEELINKIISSNIRWVNSSSEILKDKLLENNVFYVERAIKGGCKRWYLDRI